MPRFLEYFFDCRLEQSIKQCRPQEAQWDAELHLKREKPIPDLKQVQWFDSLTLQK